ncbi:MAG: HNH endonuclease signature motif containing protein [Lachnospiraceae bacterium]|nr:HNH endonuclease signature motif containing protein [Lachnospiraceae bacterium]
MELRIYNGKSKIYDFRRELYAKGFRFEKKAYGKSYYHRLVSSDAEVIAIQKFCSDNRLCCETIEKEFLRNSSYRKTFYDSMPLFIGKYYICAYCGRLLKKEQCTVDHIYPVDKVAHSRSLQKELQKYGTNDVNDFSNLVAACRRCNSHKHSKWEYGL